MQGFQAFLLIAGLWGKRASVVLGAASLVYFMFFAKVFTCFSKTFKKKGKIYIAGNGGSASDAQHLATELTVRFSKDRKPIAAISLSTDTSALTAIGNDIGFDYIFSRQIEAIGSKGDIAIGISTSGKSKNIINGLKKAREMQLKCLAFTGNNTTFVRDFCQEIIAIPAKNTSRIQEMHILIGQMLCNALEHNLGLADLVKEEK